MVLHYIASKRSIGIEPNIAGAELKLEQENQEQEILQWVDEYFASGENETRNLVTVLQALQDQFGYLPKTGMKQIAAKMGLTPANVFGVATFYNQFRFVPPGKHHIKVCMGTACAIKQGQLIQDHWERKLGIESGQVTEDREYSLDRVDCVGCCTLAPVVVMGDEVIAEMSPTKIDGILFQHQMQREKEARESKEGGK
jgi:NADH-quinone oxidoreductase subunit E